MSTYSIIPQEQWVDGLVDRFPDAPLVQNYRVLVFADKETAQLKSDYAERGIVELSLYSEITGRMESGLKSWIISQVEPLREVMRHFNPHSDEVTP